MTTANSTPPNIICFATFFKGGDFMRECKAAGCNVILVTKQASGTAKIDPLMAAFNAKPLMVTNPWSAQPSITWI